MVRDEERHDEKESYDQVSETPQGALHSIDDDMFHKFMTERELAVSWLQDYFPELEEEVELAGLQVEPNEFYGRHINKRIADVVYLFPFRHKPGYAQLTLILEHKSRIVKSELRQTLIQTASYVVNQLFREVKRNGSSVTIPQPLAAVIYTGNNRSLTELRWDELFPLPSYLMRFGVVYNLPVVNMRNLLLAG